MRTLFWIIAIFALAAGLVVAARHNAGYALLVLPPYRVELSLNLLCILLAAAFVVGYVLIRMISGTVRLPARVHAYRLARRQQRAQATLLEALQEFFAGRYAKAERAASDSIKQGDHAALCAILAARAAHELRRTIGVTLISRRPRRSLQMMMRPGSLLKPSCCSTSAIIRKRSTS